VKLVKFTGQMPMKEVARIQKKKDIRKMPKQKGFSLIELLIVVAIILIIASIAIPNLLRARISANDSAAAATMRTIISAEVLYSTTYVTTGYATSLLTLGPNGTACTAPTSAAACLVDNVVGCVAAICPKGGYNYFLVSSVATLPIPDFTASASPLGVGATGSHNYCSNTDAIVRVNAVIPAVKLAAAETLANCAAIAKYVALQ
jgi:type IV pilus assembly protein PilA